MKNKSIIEFKEVLRRGMIANFEKYGYLTPILFFYMKNQPVISIIPGELLGSRNGKELIAGMIRKICQEKPVLAAGIIIEANAAKMNEKSELTKLIENGDLKISELKEKQDIILMLFSTPEKEEIIMYVVDCKNKTVGEPFADGFDATGMQGTFSNFFTAKRN
jgi:hypothetical protein